MVNIAQQLRTKTHNAQVSYQRCGLRPSVLGQDLSETKKSDLITNGSRQGRSQKFAKGDKTGSGGRKPSSGVQGQSPGGGLGSKPPEAGDIY